MAVVGLVFAEGHPFERQRVALVGPAAAALRPALEGRSELRLRATAGEAEALGALRSRMVSAVIAPGPGGEPVVRVGPRSEVIGRGLVTMLPPGARLELVDLPRWGYVHYLFPGIVTLTVLVSGFFGMGYPMVRYRQNLFLKKLSTTTLPRWVFVASQLGARAALTWVQAALMVGAAVACFGLPLSAGGLGWLLGLVTLGIVVFMGLGFALASFIETESAMVDAINVLTTPFVLLSEVFFSVESLPGPLPLLAGALPSTQLVRLLRAVLLEGEGSFAALAPGLLVLVAWAVGAYALSLVAFRWR
jgi:ABC-2 type transport system permease protein